MYLNRSKMFKSNEWSLLTQENRNALIKLKLKMQKDSPLQRRSMSLRTTGNAGNLIDSPNSPGSAASPENHRMSMIVNPGNELLTPYVPNSPDSLLVSGGNTLNIPGTPNNEV